MEKLREELRKAQEQLVTSARLAEMGMMSAMIIHELKQPLFGIKSFALLLLEKMGKDDPIRPKAEVILAQAKTMEGILEKFNGFLQGGSSAFSDVDVNDAIENALQILEHQLKKIHITVVKETDRGVPMVRGDRRLLTQVFVNLLVNSKDAIESCPAGKIGIKTGSNENGVEAIIYDNGAGIDAGQKEKIFEPFFTTKGEGRGTGLGLFICREILKRHSGTIELMERASHEGWAFAPTTAFRVLLPARSPPVPASRPDAETGENT